MIEEKNILFRGLDTTFCEPHRIARALVGLHAFTTPSRRRRHAGLFCFIKNRPTWLESEPVHWYFTREACTVAARLLLPFHHCELSFEQIDEVFCLRLGIKQLFNGSCGSSRRVLTEELLKTCLYLRELEISRCLHKYGLNGTGFGYSVFSELRRLEAKLYTVVSEGRYSDFEQAKLFEARYEK